MYIPFKPGTLYKAMKRIYKALILIFCLGGVLTACHKFSPKPTWDANILAPLVSANMSISNLVTDSLIHQNADSSITLIYNGSLYNVNTDSLVKIPDTTIQYAYFYISPKNDTLYPGNILPFPAPAYTQYGGGSAEITKAIIQSGYVVFEVTSHIHGLTDFTYSVPSATIGTSPLSVTEVVPAAVGTTPGHRIDSVSLNGYTVDFSGKTHNGYNSILTGITGMIDPGGSQTVLRQFDSLIIKATFHSIVPYYAQGYFGNITKSYVQTTPFTIFKKITAGTLNVQSLNVNLTLQNDLGVDGQVNINKLISINSRTGDTVALTDAGLINKAIDITRATQTYIPSNPVNPTTLSFNITPANSNILKWIDNLPTSVGYSATITTDPLGNVSGFHDFAFLGYTIQSNLNISMPLSLIANNLTLADTLPVNFSTNTQAQNVKSGTFTLYYSNGFPFSAGMQIYLLDNNMKVEDSLISPPQTIAAGIMNASGIVIAPSNSSIVMTLAGSKVQEMINAKHIIMMARFNMGSLPTTYRKIYSYNYLNVKLVGNFDYLIKG